MLKYSIIISFFCITVLIPSKGVNAQYGAHITGVPPDIGHLPVGPGPLPDFNNSTGLPDLRDRGPDLGPAPNLGPSYGSGAGGGSGGGPGTGATIANAAVIGVCMADSNYNDGCWSNSLFEASSRLTEIYLKMIGKKIVTNSLVLRFPNAMAETDQLRFIQKLEDKVVKLVAAKLRHDVQSITPFNWRMANYQQINEWEARANSQTSTGSNWSHDWPSNTHTAQLGYAYGQALSINLHGVWRGN